MSHRSRMRSDMVTFPCRPSCSRRATCHSCHVAPLEDPLRHATAAMSLRSRIPCDMRGLPCRSAQGSPATCNGSNAPRHDREVRHGSVCGRRGQCRSDRRYRQRQRERKAAEAQSTRRGTRPEEKKTVRTESLQPIGFACSAPLRLSLVDRAPRSTGLAWLTASPGERRRHRAPARPPTRDRSGLARR